MASICIGQCLQFFTSCFVGNQLVELLVEGTSGSGEGTREMNIYWQSVSTLTVSALPSSRVVYVDCSSAFRSWEKWVIATNHLRAKAELGLGQHSV